jgi:hypothetical protein
MGSNKVTTEYDCLYDATRAEALNWSPARLRISLGLIMHRGEQHEAWWGPIDAISDLSLKSRIGMDW